MVAPQLLLWLWIPIAAAPAAGENPWIADQASPLATVDPQDPLDDLAWLAPLIGDAHVVALGEATHGSREFFLMKHRLIRALVERHGFTVVAFEASMADADAVGRYVRGGGGDAADLVSGMGFWTWNTEEVVELVEWMRAHDAGAGDLTFTGFDMQIPVTAMQRLRDRLDSTQPELVGQAAAAHDQLLDAMYWQLPAYASVTVDVEEGTALRWSGSIRTADVRRGEAALSWVFEDEQGAPLHWDYMAGRGATGSAAWQPFTLELAVPPGTASVRLGVWKAGSGSAWFDDLGLTVDGEPSLRFGFEEGQSGGLEPTMLSADKVGEDVDVALSGSRSLRVTHPTKGNPRKARNACREILEEIEDPVAAHLAHLVLQAAELTLLSGRRRMLRRDQYMADNVDWLLEQSPERRIVLWGHNAHVGLTPGRLGHHLQQRHGDDYVTVGFTTGRGEYTARGSQGLTAYPLTEPEEGTVESLLAKTGLPRFVLVTRGVGRDVEGAEWLWQRRDSRDIGAGERRDQFSTTVVGETYDALIWISETTATRVRR